MINEYISNNQFDINKIYESIDIMLIKNENTTVKQIFTETFDHSTKDNQNLSSKDIATSSGHVLDRRKSSRLRSQAPKSSETTVNNNNNNNTHHLLNDNNIERNEEMNKDIKSSSQKRSTSKQKNKLDYYSEFDIDEFNDKIKVSSIRLTSHRKQPQHHKVSSNNITSNESSKLSSHCLNVKRKHNHIKESNKSMDGNVLVPSSSSSTNTNTITFSVTAPPINEDDEDDEDNDKLLLLLLFNDDQGIMQPLVYQHHQQLQNEQDLTLEELSLRCFLYKGKLPFIVKIYQHINNLDTYKSFLELIDSYDQQLLDQQCFITYSTPFLSGNSSLLEDFRLGILSTRKKKYSITTIHANDDNNKNNIQENINSLKENTPSYRQIPTTWQNQICSGRDEICWEVLNDEYASHPTWASEDGGFLLTKKNKYEESIHLVDEERYALDIELNDDLNSICILKKIGTRLDHIPSSELILDHLLYEIEESENSVYTQLMDQLCYNSKRIELLNLFRKYSSNTLPELIVILERKVEELKKTKLEREKAWKSIVEKNYYKSLDHQWTIYKSEGRKKLTQHNLLEEISALWHEKHQSKPNDLLIDNYNDDDGEDDDDSNAFSIPVPQFEFKLNDISVIEDVMQLMIISYSDQLNYGMKSTGIATNFIRYHLSAILGLPPLLRKRDENHHHSHSHTESKIQTQTFKHYSHSTFIGNVSFYYMFRYFQMAYEILYILKSLSNQYKSQPEATKRLVTASLDLKTDKKFISGVEYDYSTGYYNVALKIIEAYLKNQFEQIILEEEMRYIFGIQAFHTFNLGKIFLYMTRQVHQIITGPYTRKLFDLYIKNQEATQNLENKYIIASYRLSVGYLLGSNERFMIQIDRNKGLLLLYILLEDELLFSYETKRFDAYLNSYQDPNNSTYDVDYQKLSPAYLKRNLPKETSLKGKRNVNYHYNKQELSYRLSHESYRLFFENGTEDVYIKQI
ncbi:unnamed protein product [Cunninghamella blakesleeana]